MMRVVLLGNATETGPVLAARLQVPLLSTVAEARSNPEGFVFAGPASALHASELDAELSLQAVDVDCAIHYTGDETLLPQRDLLTYYRGRLIDVDLAYVQLDPVDGILDGIRESLVAS